MQYTCMLGYILASEQLLCHFESTLVELTAMQCTFRYAGIGQLSNLRGLQHLNLHIEVLNGGITAAIATMTGATTQSIFSRARQLCMMGFPTANRAVSHTYA